LKRIMVPTDFFESSKKAIDYAVDLAKRYNAELILLSVVDDRIFQDGFLDAFIEQEVIRSRNGVVEERLKAIKKEITDKEPSLKVRWKMSLGIVFTEILHYAKEENVDLIVMGTHGTTGLAHVLIGSTTEKIVRKATCSVLVVR